MISSHDDEMEGDSFWKWIFTEKDPNHNELFQLLELLR